MHQHHQQIREVKLDNQLVAKRSDKRAKSRNTFLFERDMCCYKSARRHCYPLRRPILVQLSAVKLGVEMEINVVGFDSRKAPLVYYRSALRSRYLPQEVAEMKNRANSEGVKTGLKFTSWLDTLLSN